MYQQPGPPAPPPQQVHISIKLDRSTILPLVVVLVAMVFFIVAAVMPWYTVSSKGSGSYGGYSISTEQTTDMDSQGMSTLSKTTNSITGTTSKTEKKSWAQYTEDYKKSNKDVAPKVPTLYTTNLALTAVALVLAIVAMVLLLLKRSPKLLAIILVIGGVMGIVAIAVMAGLHPQYIRDDSHATSIPDDGPGNGFMGSNTTNVAGFSSNYSWGPGIGWYMALVGSIVMFVAAALLFLRKPKQQPAYPAPYAAPAPAQPYQQPPAGYGPPGYQPPPAPPMQQGYATPPFGPQPGGEPAPQQYGSYPPPSQYAPPPVPPQQPAYGPPPGPPYNAPPPQ